MRKAVIIGAGPAGLTAAYELLKNTDIRPVVLEMSPDVGGLSRTVDYKGNRIDIGGHRFFSKSARVMNWWQEMMPVQEVRSGGTGITHQSPVTPGGVCASTPAGTDKADLVMLTRSRVSRILYRRRFFHYPISLSADTIRNLGIFSMARIMASYMYAAAFPIRNEITLQDFMINRFGRELYNVFFKDYTEKVWGVKCSDISAEWGVQRIKGLSITRAVSHALTDTFTRRSSIDQRGKETSLISTFLYPKLGPGQMWQEVSRRILAMGGELHLNSRVKSLEVIDGKVRTVTVLNADNGREEVYDGDYFISTMPVKDLIESLHGDPVPPVVRSVASGLLYRDFIVVGLLLRKLHVTTGPGRRAHSTMPDNWIYVQERDVKVGRLQIFNNWSPYMVKDPDTVWLGLEYCCNEGDRLWIMSDEEFRGFAIDELVKIGFILKEDVLDSTLIRVLKTYPAYFGTYEDIQVVRDFTDRIGNLFLIGRNGMHKYNNQDHSMLTAMAAVESISSGTTAKDNIWRANSEEQYHEGR